MSQGLLEGTDERLPWLVETKPHLSVHIVRMEFSLNGHPLPSLPALIQLGLFLTLVSYLHLLTLVLHLLIFFFLILT